MTKQQAEMAMEERIKVAGGKRGTEDYDAGIILALDGFTATVAWDCGVKTPYRVKDLRFA